MDFIKLRAPYPGGKCMRTQLQVFISRSTLLRKKLGNNSGLIIYMFFHLSGTSDDDFSLYLQENPSVGKVIFITLLTASYQKCFEKFRLILA